jgi:hypothetical protein
MLQDQNRGFAGNAGNVAIAKFVGNEIAQEHDGFS